MRCACYPTVIREIKKMGRILINCLIISALLGLITPFFIMVEYVPEKGTEFRDFKENDFKKIRSLSDEEVVEYVEENVKLRKLSGFERITYIFESPFSALIYSRTAFGMFLAFLFGSLSLSYLNFKTKQAKHNNNN